VLNRLRITQSARGSHEPLLRNHDRRGVVGADDGPRCGITLPGARAVVTDPSALCREPSTTQTVVITDL
jgi:hypothetical protein